MADAQARNIGLMVAAAALLVGAGINILSGLQTLADRPSLLQEGMVTAAVNYWAWSSLAFGIIEAVAAIMIFNHQREGAAIGYAMIVLAAVYWLADISVQRWQSVLALVALAATAVLIAVSRDALE